MYADQKSNIVTKAILRARWQEEDEGGMQRTRPWLRRFLTRVVGMTVTGKDPRRRIPG